jgi:restriction endonuclease Mrr
VAVVVRRDGREVGRERVAELRGALHHYGPAVAGWIVTTGQVLSGAREEAAAPGAAPITLVDGNRLVRLCEEHGVAVQETRLTLPLPDLDLLDALRSS